MSASATDVRVPRLHVVTDDDVLARSDLLRVGERILRSSPDVALHLRGPGTTGRRLHRIARGLRERAADAPGMLVVNDRVDVALAAGADAVQLGSRSLRPDDLPASAAGLRVGVSVHRPEEAGALVAVDWLVLGTIFATPSHPGRPGGGDALVAEVVRVAIPPTIAIGGITPRRVPGVLRAGAYGVAVLRGAWGAPDPVAAVRRYLSTIASDANPDGKKAP